MADLFGTGFSGYAWLRMFGLSLETCQARPPLDGLLVLLPTISPWCPGPPTVWDPRVPQDRVWSLEPFPPVSISPAAAEQAGPLRALGAAAPATYDRVSPPRRPTFSPLVPPASPRRAVFHEPGTGGQRGSCLVKVSRRCGRGWSRRTEVLQREAPGRESGRLGDLKSDQARPCMSLTEKLS